MWKARRVSKHGDEFLLSFSRLELGTIGMVLLRQCRKASKAAQTDYCNTACIGAFHFFSFPGIICSERGLFCSREKRELERGKVV